MREDAVWQAVLDELEVTLSPGNYVTWFKSTRFLKLEGDTLVIGVVSPFVRQQLEDRWGSTVLETLRKQNAPVSRVVYQTMSADAVSARPETDTAPVASPAGSLPAINPQQQADKSNLRQALNERYTFDNFVVGDGNELAFAACQSIATHPGRKYNPLYLHGGVGIGKTHLIQAVGNALQAANPDAKILYIATEQFVREFVAALKARTTESFAKYYRSADVLIVDDVQFIAGKDKMQEEFFHTFNTLQQANKQVILSSDKPPRDIAMLEERLQSRFAGGMCIDMQMPDFETRCAIIQTKAENHQAELDPEVVEYLATNVQTNIRELEGALNQLLAFCEVRGLPPSTAIAASLLQTNKNRPKHLSAKQIIERTARYFQIPIEDIVGPKRDKDIVVPRQVAMYMLHEELRLSYPKIARELGRKDHTTAMHSVRKIAQESQIDPSLRGAITEIKEHLYA